MSKKIATWMMTLAMVLSVLCLPVVSYGSAEDADTDSGVQEEEEAKQPPKVEKVVGAKAKAVSSDEIDLTWSKVSGASGYEVYKYNSAKGKYNKIETTKANKCESTQLKPDTAYRYQIRAYVNFEGERYYGNFSQSVKDKTDKSDSQKVVAKAKKKLGSAYRHGASGPNVFDCSGFVYWVYNNAGVYPKKKIVRTSSAGLYSALKKYEVGASLKSVKKAKSGDIVLFTRGGRFRHAAIYVGKGKIIHAANRRKGVVTQSIRQLHRSGTRVAAIIRVVE